jgi:phosphatidate phosphatase APP1
MNCCEALMPRVCLEVVARTRRAVPKFAVTLAVVLALFAVPNFGCAAALKSDEQVLLYPAVARPVPGGLELEIHGIVYEPERRALLADLIRRLTGVDEAELSAAEMRIFKERCRYFLVDNERGKQISARLGQESFALGTSAANGHFSSTLVWKGGTALAAPQETNGPVMLKLTFEGVPRIDVPFEAHVLAETGVSVVSDIDDTIKVSDVLDKKALLRNTFCKPFKPVSGMAAVYQEWARSAGAQFHYVTASPWQLYLPLSEFSRSNGFPSGTFHMKNFRVKDESLLQLFASPERYKPGVIEPLLRRFPKRQFILVGDSGEMDPEIYGALARQHPGQVRGIFIRDVGSETDDAPRYGKAFAGLPRDLWRVFKEPGEIRDGLGPVPERR